MIHPLYLRMTVEISDDLESVLNVPFHPQRERFQTLNKQKRIERRNSRTLISHKRRPYLKNVRNVPASFCENYAVI